MTLIKYTISDISDADNITGSFLLHPVHYDVASITQEDCQYDYDLRTAQIWAASELAEFAVDEAKRLELDADSIERIQELGEASREEEEAAISEIFAIINGQPVRLVEAGNGFPKVGAVVDIAGSPHRVVVAGSTIHTDAPGRGNYIYGRVTPCDWPEDEEDIFPVRAEVC